MNCHSNSYPHSRSVPLQLKKAGDKDIDDIKTLMEEVRSSSPLKTPLFATLDSPSSLPNINLCVP